MNGGISEDHRDDCRVLLRRMALEYRGFPLELVDQVEPQECQDVINQFAVWLLVSARQTLRTEAQIETYRQVLTLRERRRAGEPIDAMEWESSRAESLAASRLWPPEWICAPCLPGAPPIVRAAATIAAAISRRQADDAEKISFQECRALQSAVLRGFLTRLEVEDE